LAERDNWTILGAIRTFLGGFFRRAVLRMNRRRAWA
jgi:hypothetical protein